MFQIRIAGIFDISQPAVDKLDQDIRKNIRENIRAIIKDKKAPKRVLNRVGYVLFCPLFFAYSELRLLVTNPTRLSNDRFYGEYEIFKIYILGTVNGILAIVSAILSLYVNSGSAIAAYLLILASILMMTFSVLFAHQFSVDDESKFHNAFIDCHLLPSRAHASEDPLLAADVATDSSAAIENVTSIPLYKTIRYREELDFRKCGKLKDYEMYQLINIMRRSCQISELWFDAQNKISMEIAKVFYGYMTSGHFGTVENINYLNIHELPSSASLVISPDTLRAESLFQPLEDELLVPWNEDINWYDGIPGFREKYYPTAQDTKIFPFLATVALNIVDPFRLVELDLGGNSLTDEMVPIISTVIEKSPNLFIIELCGNRFSLTNQGFPTLVDSIVKNKSITHVRFSTVLLNIDELRKSEHVDLSLPRIYAIGIERVVQSIFEACLEVDSLKSSFFGVAKKGNKRAIEQHYMMIRDLIARDYRLLGRDFYRSVPPRMLQLLIQRVAHRVGKYVIPDPGIAIDLAEQRATDGLFLTSDISLIEERLYLSFLSQSDMLLICEIIRNRQTVLKDIDFHGMPLVGDLMRPLMQMLANQASVRTINLTGCGIRNPEFLQLLIDLLKQDHQNLREISMKGNLAVKGMTKELNEIIDIPGRKSRPHLAVDQTFTL